MNEVEVVAGSEAATKTTEASKD